MKYPYKYIIFALIFSFLHPTPNAFSQEPLQSSIYEYYRVLELNPGINRKSLNIHSLSFNQWDMRIPFNDHPWGNSLIEFTAPQREQIVYLFPLFQSYSFNSKYPRGFNDGAAWQGKGINGQWSGGIKVTKGGLSVTINPLIWYSQNLSFPLVPSVHESSFASYIPNIDLPQRFGDSPIFQFNLGESEIRYDIESVTLGFGNQSIWLGPTFFNSIILSNNAGGFPKIDFGLRKTYTKYGNIEFLLFLGMLNSSDYADSTIRNKNRYISGYTLSYAPSFIPGFIFGFHRVAFFYSDSWASLDFLNAFLPMGHYMGEDQLDQRASITVDWLFPEIGLNVYGEWARNDFSATLRLIMRELQHSQAYTLGLRHRILQTHTSIVIYRLEITELMHTIDYQTEVSLGRSTAGFYTHHIVQHGHTQKGQLLGAAIGPGADSQYLGVTWYSTFGKLEGYFLRRSLNKDYVYGQPDTIRYHSYGNLSVEATLGINLDLIINPRIILSSGLAGSWMIAWNYTSLNDVFNIQLSIGSRIRL
jgi:hypothetical protein